MVDLALSSVSSMDYLGQTKADKLDGTMHYHGLCLTMVVLGFSGVAPRSELDETRHYHGVR